MHGIREAIIISTQRAPIILVCAVERMRMPCSAVRLLYQRITLADRTSRYVTLRHVRRLILTPKLDADDYRMRDRTSVTDLAPSSIHTEMLQRERGEGGEAERGR